MLIHFSKTAKLCTSVKYLRPSERLTFRDGHGVPEDELMQPLEVVDVVEKTFAKYFGLVIADVRVLL